MVRILAMVGNAVMRRRLRAALDAPDAPGIWLGFVDDWVQAEVLSGLQRVHCLVFDPYIRGRLETAACHAFARRRPSVALCAYARFRGTSFRDLLLLAECGVREVLVYGEDDSAAGVRARLEALAAVPLAHRVLAVLPPIPPRLERLVAWLSENAGPALGPAAAAQQYCSHPATLRAHLRRARLPAVERLLVWMRLLRLAHLLEDESRTIESAAYELGYRSGALAGNQLKRYAGVSPSELRRLGGLDWLLEALRRELSPAAAAGPPPLDAPLDLGLRVAE